MKVTTQNREDDWTLLINPIPNTDDVVGFLASTKHTAKA
jgi:hypothetical protein